MHRRIELFVRHRTNATVDKRRLSGYCMLSIDYLHIWKNIRSQNIAETAFGIMNSLFDVSDSGQSPRGPATPWSPVRVNRRRSDPSPVTPPSSDPTSQHAQLAVADNRVDATDERTRQNRTRKPSCR